MNTKPEIQLSGEDGNVFNIIGLCKRAAKKAGWSTEEVSELVRQLMNAGSYDSVLQIILKKFEVH